MAAKPSPDLAAVAPLEFEEPILELEARIEELLDFAATTDQDVEVEIRTLRAKREKLLRETYAHLSAWQKVAVARHLERPVLSDYLGTVFSDVVELCGDRTYGEDPAMFTGFAHLEGRKVMLIGHRKGRDTAERIRFNFGCAHPEGYRKAKRAMKLAEKFHLPIVTLINTPGAYPGIQAEERGQSAAIAECLQTMIALSTPILSIVIGEGGSGGALAIAVCDRLLMLEHAYYSVISPEGCSAILFKSGARAQEAAEALKLTAQDLLGLGICDEIIPEPLGGAHRDRAGTLRNVKHAIARDLDKLCRVPLETLVGRRFERYRAIGRYRQEPPAGDLIAPNGGSADRDATPHRAI